jgi:hypothetical protein
LAFSLNAQECPTTPGFGSHLLYSRFGSPPLTLCSLLRKWNKQVSRSAATNRGRLLFLLHNQTRGSGIRWLFLQAERIITDSRAPAKSATFIGNAQFTPTPNTLLVVTKMEQTSLAVRCFPVSAVRNTLAIQLVSGLGFHSSLTLLRQIRPSPWTGVRAFSSQQRTIRTPPEATYCSSN